MSTQAHIHWADQIAQRIAAERGPLGGDKSKFTCASGITPSGVIHIGNFREIISVDLVVRALRDAGHPVRFIYSWDDFDVFRKVPAGMPRQQMLRENLRKAITTIPDPWAEVESYARRNEIEVERVLPEVGIEPEYLYQAQNYATGIYADGIRVALENRQAIREILNEHRTSPLPQDWWPIRIFSSFTGRDTTVVSGWDGEYAVSYLCEETQKEETLDLRGNAQIKLSWRIDWPMRWAHEGVDFEPAGKEHHSAGGSFDTARQIVTKVYQSPPPVTFKYDFISVKGRGGKISSSSGDVISLADVLEVYEPQVVRYLFAGTRPNAEFAISFDLDVIKIYEDYDRCERIYYGVDQVGEKREAKERRNYELSQLPDWSVADELPIQVPFRTLCNFLMITAGEIDRALEMHAAFDSSEHTSQLPRLRRRAECAWRWITSHAPEDFRFSLATGVEEPPEMSDAERAAVASLSRELLDRFDQHDEKTLGEAIYRITAEEGVDRKQFFLIMYRVLVGADRGPRLAGFLKTIGRERLEQILGRFRG